MPSCWTSSHTLHNPSSASHFEDLDLDFDNDGPDERFDDDFILIDEDDAGPPEAVEPWANAMQHSRAAAGNVLSAASKFGAGLYHSGIGTAVAAVAAATATTVRARAESTRGRFRGGVLQPVPEERERAGMTLETDGFDGHQSIEYVPVLNLSGEQAEDRDGRRDSSPSPARGRVWVGPAQRRYRSAVAEEAPTLLHHPARVTQMKPKHRTQSFVATTSKRDAKASQMKRVQSTPSFSNRDPGDDFLESEELTPYLSYGDLKNMA